MKQELMDAIQETPVIAAVKDDDGLQNALRHVECQVHTKRGFGNSRQSRP